MAVKKGELAPIFKALSTSGNEFNLESRRGKNTIIYFYPKDFTYGCSKEACSFKDEFQAFRNLEIDVFGVSKDSIESHKKFKSQYNLPFELLSDPHLRVAKLYDAKVPLINMTKRVTYLINRDLKIEAVYQDMMAFDRHVKQMLKSIA
jgi:peroxiredoxin Q/BCP